jgi:Ca2+-binding EF-hand superfamily protein
MKFRALLLGISLAVSASIGLAQQRLDSAVSAAELIRQIDTDRDGFITKEEWNRFFADHDDNKDGMLTREEAGVKDSQDRSANTVDPAVDDLFAKLDADSDGSISKTEWKGTERAFKLADANGNGLISKEEFRSPNSRFWNLAFKDVDINKDGVITRNEWLDTEDSFKRLDRDRNGVVSEREFYKLW